MSFITSSDADVFETHGVHAAFVGHPVIERAARMKDGNLLRKRLSIAPDAPLLVVLPGSLMSEVTLLTPVFREAVAQIARYDIPIDCPNTDQKDDCTDGNTPF